MSILIKGMDMPTSCSECPLLEGCSECEGYHNCCMPLGIENGYFDYPLNDLTPIDKRRDDCPLVPVPPHVGLIDADAEIEVWNMGYDGVPHAVKTTVSRFLLSHLMEWHGRGG